MKIKNTYSKNTYKEYRYEFVIGTVYEKFSTYNKYGRTRYKYFRSNTYKECTRYK